MSRVVLRKKNVLAVLRRTMAVSSLQDARRMFQKADGIRLVRCPPETQKWVRERLIALRSRDLCCNSETSQLPSPLAGLIQIYSDKTATSSKFDALVSYIVLVVSLNFT